MRLVLFFSHGTSLSTWHAYGLLDREIRFYKQLVENGLEVCFVTYGDANDYQWQSAWEGIEIFPIFAHKTRRTGKLLFWLQCFWLSRQVRRLIPKPDIIKTNQIVGGLLAVQMKKYWDSPLLVRGGYDPYKFALSSRKYWIKSLLLRAYVRTVYRAADRIHVASQQDANFAKNNYLRNKEINIIVQPNWVDTNNFKPRKSRTKSSKDNRTLAIGRAVDQKNFALLIEAISLGPYGLDIITDSFGKAELERYSCKLGADVRFLERQTHQALSVVYCQYPVYVITSKYEGHPKTLLEAMACGRAVIGTRVAGITELIDNGRTGLLVPEKPEAIQSSIRTLMLDAEYRERLGRAAREEVVSRFSLEDAIKKEVQAYKDMVTRVDDKGI